MTAFDADTLAVLFHIRGVLHHPTCVRVHQRRLVVADSTSIHFFEIPARAASVGGVHHCRTIQGASPHDPFIGCAALSPTRLPTPSSPRHPVFLACCPRHERSRGAQPHDGHTHGRSHLPPPHPWHILGPSFSLPRPPHHPNHSASRRFRRPLSLDLSADRIYLIEDGGLDDRRIDSPLGTPRCCPNPPPVCLQPAGPVCPRRPCYPSLPPPVAPSRRHPNPSHRLPDHPRPMWC